MREGYKKTEIGVIPLDWEVVELSKITTILLSNVDKKSKNDEQDVMLCNYMDVYNNQYITNDLSYMKATATDAQIEKFQLQINDVLITKDSETKDDIAIPTVVIETFDNLLCGYHLAVLRPNSKILDGIYLMKAIQSHSVHKYFEKLANGTTRFGLTSATLNKALIPLPPLTQQKKIAQILSTADEKIEAIALQIEKAEMVKKGLLQKLLSEGIGHSEFKESELGMIPLDWEVVELRDIGKVSMCKRIMKDETTDDGEIPFYKIGTFGKNANAYISQEIYEDYKKKYSFPKKGDILISASGTIGRLVIYNGKPAYFQDSNIVWIDNQENKLLNSLLFYIYKTVKWHTDGNTIARLYNENLRRIKIPLPPLKEQTKIANILSTADEKLEVLRAKKAKYEELKVGLMQKLLTGEVRV